MLAETSVAVSSSMSWFTEYSACAFYKHEINNDGKVCLLRNRKNYNEIWMSQDDKLF